MQEFVTIKNSVCTEIVEKKSKFIANLFYIESVEQAEEIVKNLKKKYFDARHNCMAYRVIEEDKVVERASDDGEPSKTAGAPMLSILRNNNLVNVLVVVTRYFGGILLGTWGLVRAYSDSLQKAIEEAEKVRKIRGNSLEVILEYEAFEIFKYYCRKNEINIVEIQYSEDINCKIEMEDEKKQRLFDDFQTKSINLKNIKELSIKYITKSI